MLDYNSHCCEMLFTHSAVQKKLSKISDLRCWMFQSGLWEKGSEVVFLNEHVYLSIFFLRCGCQTYSSVEKLNPKRMITVKKFKAIIVSIRVLGREPRSSIATNLLFIASSSQGPAVFDLGSSGGLTGAHRKKSSQKGRFVQPGNGEHLGESSMSAARRPACQTTLRAEP